MRRAAHAVAVLAVLGAGVVWADEPPTSRKPLGTWQKKFEENQIQFEVKPDTFRVTVTTPDVTIEADADYAVTKDGILFGVIRKVDKKGICAGPMEGDLFSFRYTVNNNVLTIKDLHGTDNEEAKQLLQGEYHAKGTKRAHK